MSRKHLNILWVIVALGLGLVPSFSWAKGAGVLLERAQVSTVESGEALQVELTIRNQLSVHVNAVELAIECRGTTSFASSGRRAMTLAPGTSVSAYLVLKAPAVKPRDCTVRLLGYVLEKPTEAVLKMLLRTGFSADERAVLLSSLGTKLGINFQKWSEQTPSQTPDIHEVLERLLSWSVLAAEATETETWSEPPELERFDQPLQIVLAAREQGSRFSSPIAFLLPDGVSTMKDAWSVFQKGEFRPVQELKDFQVGVLNNKQAPKPAESDHFYRTLSLVLLSGIIIWALWGLRKKPFRSK